MVEFKDDVETAANTILSTYGFANQIPLQIVALAETIGLRVLFASFEDDNISGAITTKQTPPTIYVNTNDNRHRQRFTVAHEIGHYFLHMRNKDICEMVDMYRGNQHTKAEREANMFACALLMDEQKIAGDFRFLSSNQNNVLGYREISDKEIVKALANKYDVSISAMQIRLNVLGLIRSV